MKIYACRESKNAVLRGMIYSVPKSSRTTISLRSSPYLHIQIAPVILMTTFLRTCEDTQFQKLALPLGLAYGVTHTWIWEQFCSCGCGKSHTYCCLWNCTSYSIGITHNCFHKIRRKELEQSYWYKSWWQHVLQVQKVMLTWENTSLDSKIWELKNRSAFPSIKNSAAECFCEEKKAVATFPQFIPNRGQQDAAFLVQIAPFKPPNRPTSLLDCEQFCLSALLFGLNASVTKRTQTPKCPSVCHREV